MKIGIAGLGFMGATHYDAFSTHPDVAVAAVFSNNPAALKGDLTHVGGNLDTPKEKYDFSDVRKYRDWRGLVADEDLDAIDICLPTDLHVPVAVAALAAGKHVFCEKPMAATPAGCEQMLIAAERAGRILMIGQVLRFWPEYNYLQEFVREGKNGTVRSATFVRGAGLPDWSGWLLDETRSGGAILDMLVHDIDQALLLFGVPERVAAKSLGAVDTVAATLVYPGGPEVRIQGGWFPAGTPFSMSFHVTAERGEIEFSSSGLRVHRGDGRYQTVTLGTVSSYQAEAAYFAECCRTHTPPVRCMPADSAKAVQLALLLKESRARGGEPVPCVL